MLLCSFQHENYWRLSFDSNHLENINYLFVHCQFIKKIGSTISQFVIFRIKITHNLKWIEYIWKYLWLHAMFRRSVEKIFVIAWVTWMQRNKIMLTNKKTNIKTNSKLSLGIKLFDDRQYYKVAFRILSNTSLIKHNRMKPDFGPPPRD